MHQGPGKKWEHYELTANGKPVRIPMHVKKGDTVQIISGDDKGKVGEIAKVRSLAANSRRARAHIRPSSCRSAEQWLSLATHQSMLWVVHLAGS